MKWFRSNIKHGSRLALLALALQFALSFGHFHSAAQAAALTFQSVAAQTDASEANASSVTDTTGKSARQAPSKHDSDPSSDPCAICAVIALAGSVMAATPPLLPLPRAAEFSYLVPDAGFIHPNPARAAFQPRAPPAS